MSRGGDADDVIMHGLTPVRRATRRDVPGMHAVRMAVRENRLISKTIEEQDYVAAIETTGRGWLIEQRGDVVAFAVGNAENGNIWALFVDPAHEGRGFGRALHDVMIGWLFEQGLTRLHLGTAPGTRAQRFYETNGWRFVEIDAAGEAIYERFAEPAKRR